MNKSSLVVIGIPEKRTPWKNDGQIDFFHPYNRSTGPWLWSNQNSTRRMRKRSGAANSWNNCRLPTKTWKINSERRKKRPEVHPSVFGETLNWKLELKVSNCLKNRLKNGWKSNVAHFLTNQVAQWSCISFFPTYSHDIVASVSEDYD